jgi:hypothetical protein
MAISSSFNRHSGERPGAEKKMCCCQRAPHRDIPKVKSLRFLFATFIRVLRLVALGFRLCFLQSLLCCRCTCPLEFGTRLLFLGRAEIQDAKTCVPIFNVTLRSPHHDVFLSNAGPSTLLMLGRGGSDFFVPESCSFGSNLFVLGNMFLKQELPLGTRIVTANSCAFVLDCITCNPLYYCLSRSSFSLR